MKRIITLVCLLCLLVSLVGCGGKNITQLIEDVTGAVTDVVKMSDSDMYSALTYAIDNPDNSSTTLNGKLTFSAWLASETFEQTFTGEDKVYTYQLGYISRYTDKPIYFDVTDLATTIPEDTYVTVTGEIVGTVYWTEDNSQVEVLDFHVEKMDAFTVAEPTVDTSNSLTVIDGTRNGTFSFVGAHYSKTSFDDVVVVYFNYTNNEPASSVEINSIGTLFDQIYVDIGGETGYTRSIRSAFKPDEIDGAALDASSLSAFTPSGRTQLYYIVITLEDGERVESDVLYFDMYNDDFAFTNCIEVPVAENLEMMNSASH